MRSVFTLLLACSVLLFSNCDSSIDSETTYGMRSSTLHAGTTDSIPISADISIHVKNHDGSPAPPDSISAQVESAIDAEIARQLKLNPDIPEYMEVSEAYENMTVQVFSEIAAASGGETFMIENAELVVGAITDIIRSYMSGETDLVFLIDKTGSMSDDINKIQRSIKLIISMIEPFPDARVGFAFYGDKNVDSNWFHYTALTSDFDACKKTVKNIRLSGGGDGPESVYDGIALTIEKMNWEGDHRRMILLIGDAPPLEKPGSDYDLAAIIDMTREAGVTMNFYPVVIGVTGDADVVKKIEVVKPTPASIISSLSPNPATNLSLLKTTVISDYVVEVFDINGRLIDRKTFHDHNIPIYTDSYSTGVYIVRLIDLNNKTTESRKLVVKH